ncbi:MAG: hypothetical protein DRJ40_08510 [Thermoprotei archaeon]|nr:MAG: hypothetical protein DRJ40_08510 [Thermoprotei archaeon]
MSSVDYWSCIQVSNRVVLDVGIGNSTRKVLDLGAKYVVGLDVDRRKIRGSIRDVRLDLVLGDCSRLPFRCDVFELVLFHFTLHEVAPYLHEDTIREAGRVGRGVAIVEILPDDRGAYGLYARLWHEAMHSVGRYEDYRDVDYWVSLVERCGLRVELVRVLPGSMVSLSELEKVIENDIVEWRRLGVSEVYVQELRRVLECARVCGFRWSNTVLVVGVRM